MQYLLQVGQEDLGEPGDQEVEEDQVGHPYWQLEDQGVEEEAGQVHPWEAGQGEVLEVHPYLNTTR